MRMRVHTRSAQMQNPACHHCQPVICCVLPALDSRGPASRPPPHTCTVIWPSPAMSFSVPCQVAGASCVIVTHFSRQAAPGDEHSRLLAPSVLPSCTETGGVGAPGSGSARVPAHRSPPNRSAAEQRATPRPAGPNPGCTVGLGSAHTPAHRPAPGSAGSVRPPWRPGGGWCLYPAPEHSPEERRRRDAGAAQAPVPPEHGGCLPAGWALQVGALRRSPCP